MRPCSAGAQGASVHQGTMVQSRMPVVLTSRTSLPSSPGFFHPLLNMDSFHTDQFGEVTPGIEVTPGMSVSWFLEPVPKLPACPGAEPLCSR